MKRSRFGYIALLLALLLLLTACSGRRSDGTNVGGDAEALPIEVIGEDYPLTVRDFIGTETVLERAPERVAVLSGAPLNIWYDVGGKAVCASTVSSNLKVVEEYEAEIRALPSIGGVMHVDLEAIVSYEPDLIIAQEGSQSDEIVQLRAMGYKVIVTYLRDLDDVIATYRAFGRIVGDAVRAEARIGELTERCEELAARAPTEPKTVVILYLTSKKLQVKLGGSIAGIVADGLGIVNVASGLSPVEEGSENATLDIEYLVACQPDMILVTSMISDNATAVSTMEKHLSENDAWKGVAAARNGSIVYLPQEYFLYNAGPYFDEAVRYMACSVYPEIYGDLDAWYGKRPDNE